LNGDQPLGELGDQGLCPHLRGKARNDDPVVRSRWVLENIRETNVTRDENSPALLRQLEDCWIRRSAQFEINNVRAFVALLLEESTQRPRKVFINEEAGH